MTNGWRILPHCSVCGATDPVQDSAGLTECHEAEVCLGDRPSAPRTVESGRVYSACCTGMAEIMDRRGSQMDTKVRVSQEQIDQAKAETAERVAKAQSERVVKQPTPSSTKVQVAAPGAAKQSATPPAPTNSDLMAIAAGDELVLAPTYGYMPGATVKVIEVIGRLAKVQLGTEVWRVRRVNLVKPTAKQATEATATAS